MNNVGKANIFEALLDSVKENATVTTNAAAGDILGLTPAVVAQSRSNPRTRKSWWETRYKHLWDQAFDRGIEEGRKELVQRLLNAIEESHTATTQAEKALAFGVTSAAITQWRNGTTAPTKNNLLKLLKKRARIRVKSIAELEPINPVNKGGGWWVDADQTQRQAWRTRLSGRHGLYVYYDSRGRVSYVGKADMTSLFHEVEQRLRDQKLRGTHFGRSLKKHSERRNALCQGHIARLLSVYEVSDNDSIHNLEALLIRAYMNDNLNRRKENFRN